MGVVQWFAELVSHTREGVVCMDQPPQMDVECSLLAIKTAGFFGQQHATLSVQDPNLASSGYHSSVDVTMYQGFS